MSLVGANGADCPRAGSIRYSMGVTRVEDRIEPPNDDPVVEHFEIERSIAKGGMAEVYEATGFLPGGDSMRVCIKKILPHLTQDRASMSMFLDEARLASTLRHPNIVQVYDLCQSQEQEYFIVMEYVDGLDVSRLLRRARRAGASISVPVAVRIVQEVCRALRYAHEKTDEHGRSLRIIHRDISPQNILVSRSGDVKLTDFGIAKSTIVMTTTAVGLLKGKYGYMSPEQARGEPLDHRSDLYNVGIIAYELLVGRRCFKGDNDFQTLELMRNAVVTPPRRIDPGLPEALEAVVLKALARHPRDRFQTADELERALVLCPGVHPCSREELALHLERASAPAAEPSADIPSASSLSLSSLVKAVEPMPPAPAEPPPRRWPVRALGAIAAGIVVGAVGGWLTRGPGAAAAPPAASEAIVVVESTPPGAVVFLDGIELAHPTPVVVRRPRGDDPIEVRLEHGREQREDVFRVKDREVVELRYDLRRAVVESTARVRVESIPRSEVFVDGRPAGPSKTWLNIPADRPADVSVRSDDAEVELRLELRPNETRKLFLDLSDVWL